MSGFSASLGSQPIVLLSIIGIAPKFEQHLSHRSPFNHHSTGLKAKWMINPRTDHVMDMRGRGCKAMSGNCCKWLCAPKGAAFLYARPEVQPWLEPLVVSWGYESAQPSGSQFIDYHEWQGTRDLAAFLTVPAAIEFQTQHGWT